jgi:hypothetical protein
MELGASGPTYLALDAFPRPSEQVRIERWAERETPTDDELASIRRELLRAQGRPEWQP